MRSGLAANTRVESTPPENNIAVDAGSVISSKLSHNAASRAATYSSLGRFTASSGILSKMCLVWVPAVASISRWVAFSSRSTDPDMVRGAICLSAM